MKNYYEILGLNKGASQEDIRKAYYKLAQEWHPDKHQNGDIEAAEAKFKEISEAYENLKNGVETDQDNRSQHFTQQDDINEMLKNFARMHGFNFGHNPQQQDFYEEVLAPVTIQNLYNEEDILVSVDSFTKDEVGTCPVCNGQGQTTTSQRQGNVVMQRSTICYKCKGQGFTSTGPGKTTQYKVKTSINNLHRPLPLGKVGSYNPITNDYNNVLVRFDLQKSYNYSLVENGAGLMMVLPVLYEHLRDGKKLRITIFGNKVTVEVPEKPSLQRMIVVPGKGMPLGNGHRGNLYVKLDLKYE